jgi:hypothetical protein
VLDCVGVEDRFCWTKLDFPGQKPQWMAFCEGVVDSTMLHAALATSEEEAHCLHDLICKKMLEKLLAASWLVVCLCYHQSSASL